MLAVRVLALVAFAALACAETARLVATKEIVNSLVVQDQDITVKFTVYNVGSGAASKVQLSDNDVADMKLIAGTGTASWAQIGPGERAIHSVVVSTSASQLFNFTGAVVKYTASEESETQIITNSNAPGPVRVMNAGDYARANNLHALEWIVFFALVGVAVGLPYTQLKAKAA